MRSMVEGRLTHAPQFLPPWGTGTARSVVEGRLTRTQFHVKLQTWSPLPKRPGAPDAFDDS